MLFCPEEGWLLCALELALALLLLCPAAAPWLWVEAVLGALAGPASPVSVGAGEIGSGTQQLGAEALGVLTRLWYSG